MKKLALTIVLSLVVVSIFAQTSVAPQRLKYVTNGPDGEVAMTIYDDSREDTMKLEAANAFYKYQILDSKTNEPILTANNKGKECNIEKSMIAAGTYNIRLYTSNFVITSKITISAMRTLSSVLKEDVVAMND